MKLSKYILLCIVLAGCAQPPKPGYYSSTVAVGLGFTQLASAPVPVVTPVPSPPPAPAPAPVPVVEKCPRCEGKGKVTLLGREITCRLCGGDGKKKKGQFGVASLGWVTAPDSNDGPYYQHALEVGQELNMPVLIDFCPDWCHHCQKLSIEFFDKPEIVQQLGQRFILLRVKDGNVANAFKIPQRFNNSYPLVAIVSTNGKQDIWFPGSLDKVTKTFLSEVEARAQRLGD